MIKRTLLLTTFLAAAGCAVNTNETPKDEPANTPVPSLETLWVADGFDAPESVLPSADKDFFYVSNVNGEGGEKDGNGYISKLGMDGSLIEQRWATGLNGPKGMALTNQKLYVSDIDHVVEIESGSGEILNLYEAPGAGFLNDVAFIPTVGVLASDSASQSIYQLKDGAMIKWLEDDRLSGINGLLLSENSILVSTMDAGHLLRISLVDKSITEIATGMKNADGIGELSETSLLVSSWPGQLHLVSADGTTNTILNTVEDEIYMNDLYLDGDMLYVPNWQPGTVRAFKIN